MTNILQLAAENQRKAREMIEHANIRPAWESIGATVNLVGSLRTGLLMKHLDVDFHLYTPQLNIADSFKAIGRIAENKKIKKVTYTNLLDSEDTCLEWHAWYEDDDKNTWQIDMIHIVKGSTFDGFFEKIADRISAVITPEQRHSVLQLKYDTPDTEKIAGIEYCRAVMEGNVKTYTDFQKWRLQNPLQGICLWQP